MSYGLTLNDFEYVPEGYGSCNEYGYYTVKSKDGNDDFVKKLLDEEYVLYEQINYALKYRSGIETFDCVADSNFNVSFSYKNGVTIEKGKTDQAGLDKMADKFILSPPFLKYGLNDADYSVTVNSSGFVTDANLISIGRGKGAPKILHRWQQEFNVSAIKRYSAELNNGYINETTLRQYAIDAQRLARFDLGANDEELLTMKTTFGKSNGENKTYFTLSIE